MLLAVLACGAAPARADLLTGVVRDASGAPVNNADFDLFDADGNKLLADGSTHTTGRYEIVVGPGRYDVVCQPPIVSGLASQVRRGVRIGGVTTLDWTVPPSVRVLGRVLGPAGQPLAQAELDFDRADDGSRQPALGDLTNLFGAFAAYLEAGDYRVTAYPSPSDTAFAPARLALVRLPTPDTLRFVLPPAVHLSGTVREAGGAPVGQAKLAFERARTGERAPAWGREAAADGGFRAGIEADTYRVVVQPPRGTRLVALRLGPVDLTTDRSLDVTLDPGFVVTGRVVGPDGAPLPDADWDAADEATETSVPTPYDDTEDDGSFRLVLPPGRFRLTLSPPRGLSLDTLVLRGVSVQRDTSFDVRYPGSTAPPARLRLVALGNPCYRVADLRLEMPSEGRARVEVWDVAGRRVRTLAEGWLPGGTQWLHWDGRTDGGTVARAGVYLVRVAGGLPAEIARLVLLP